MGLLGWIVFGNWRVLHPTGFIGAVVGAFALLVGARLVAGR